MFLGFSTRLKQAGRFRIGAGFRLNRRNAVWGLLLLAFIFMFQMIWYMLLLIMWLIYWMMYGLFMIYVFIGKSVVQCVKGCFGKVRSVREKEDDRDRVTDNGSEI